MKAAITLIALITILPFTASNASEYIERWTQVNVTSIFNFKTYTPDNFIQQLGNLFKTQDACNQQILKYLDEGFLAEKRGNDLVLQTDTGSSSIHCMRLFYVKEN